MFAIDDVGLDKRLIDLSIYDIQTSFFNDLLGVMATSCLSQSLFLNFHNFECQQMDVSRPVNMLVFWQSIPFPQQYRL